jgi:hypothetical protein
MSRNLLSALLFILLPVLTFAQAEEKSTYTFDKMNAELVDSTAPDKETEFRTNYNEGVKYYNEAVEALLTLEPNATFDDVIATQEKCVSLFEKALPYFQKCQELQPKNENIKRTINGIEFGIGKVSDPVPEKARK